jgi:hypothetical protein
MHSQAESVDTFCRYPYRLYRRCVFFTLAAVCQSQLLLLAMADQRLPPCVHAVHAGLKLSPKVRIAQGAISREAVLCTDLTPGAWNRSTSPPSWASWQPRRRPNSPWPGSQTC